MRAIFRGTAALALAICTAWQAPGSRAQSLPQPGPETAALQRRLLDAGCYAGPIDGTPSDAVARALAVCPTQQPQLRIETGMHIAPINQIGVDAACRTAVTGSDDKTVRVWSMADGHLLRTLRMPIGPGFGGRARAAAISPDGRWAATGGWDAHALTDHKNSVYVFDVGSGGVVARLDDFADVVLRLQFAPDGRWLAASGATLQGVRVYDTGTWRLVASDTRVGGDTYGLSFGPGGALYSVSFDGRLRRYGPGPAFAKQAEVALRGGRAPFSVAPDPLGQIVAVGYLDANAVTLLDAGSLRPRGLARAGQGGIGSLGSVAWSRDGATLLAGGIYAEPADPVRPTTLLRFGRNGQPSAAPLHISNNTVTDITTCGPGFAVAVEERGFGLVTDAGIGFRPTLAADMRDKVGGAFGVSPDARRIRYGLDYGASAPILFDLDQATVSDSPTPPGDLRPPDPEGLPVADWQNGFAPRLGGAKLALRNREVSRSLAVRPDRDGFVLGGSFRLHAYGAGGSERWNVEGPAEAWGVNMSADGRLIVAAYGDGTIRWHRWTDGQELLALFVNHDSRAWVAWTPSGYFKASPGGEDMIGWHLNRGWGQGADFFPASKFRDRFGRPDVVDRVLETLDEAEALRLADQARKSNSSTAPIIETLPPILTIVSPADHAHAADAAVRIDYLLRSPSGLAVDAVTTTVDGKPTGERGLGPAAGPLLSCLAETNGLGRIDPTAQGCRGSVTVAVPPGTSEIGLQARAGQKTSEVARLHVVRDAPAGPSETRKPDLHALVVGISDYVRPDFRLGYAAQDAKDFAGALSNQQGGLYDHVTVDLLTDRQATAGAIKDGLDRLARAVTDRDVGVLYFAGHGDVDDSRRFYFLAADSDRERLRATAVGREDITETLDGLRGQAVLFLDACHAGAVAMGPRPQFDINPVLDDFRQSERGVVIYAGSTGRQSSLENPTWGHGAFTKAIIDGLGVAGIRGKADLIGDGSITTGILNVYLARRVKDLTEGLQSPVMTSTAPDFPLAWAR